MKTNFQWIKTKTKRVRRFIDIDEQDFEKLKILANERNISMSKLIRDLIEKEVNK